MLPAEFSADLIGQWVGQHIWPFPAGQFPHGHPGFRYSTGACRVRLGLALLMTILIVPMIPPVPQVEALSADAVVITLQQILIGVGLGFALTALWQLFVIAGQMIAMQMGLGFASMVDPANGVNVPVLAQIYTITITLLFLVMNGHLVAFEVFIESFYTLPIGLEGLGQGDLWALAHRISWMFVSAMLLALPAVTAVLIVNISFGVMTRAAPQMNIFALGFPIGLIFGLFAIWVLHANFCHTSISTRGKRLISCDNCRDNHGQHLTMAEENDNSQEKTEEPTPRRLEKAKDEGQTARSKELATMAALLAGAGGLLIFGYVAGRLPGGHHARFLRD